MDTRNKTRGIRNNNPCNIRRSRDIFSGEIESNDASFKQFIAIEYGYRAAIKILHTYFFAYCCRTITDIIFRWAPPGDGNKTNEYIDYVAWRVGVDSAKKIEWDKEIVLKIVDAMSRMECGFSDKKKIEKGWEMQLKY